MHDEFTMLELAKKVLALVDGPSMIKFRPLPKEAPKQNQSTIAMPLKKMVGTQPYCWTKS